MAFNVMLDSEELRVLKSCRKRRRLTCRDESWMTLSSLVHKSLLDRILSEDGKNAGWSYYKLSKRGRKFLDSRKY